MPKAAKSRENLELEVGGDEIEVKSLSAVEESRESAEMTLVRRTVKDGGLVVCMSREAAAWPHQVRSHEETATRRRRRAI